MEPLSAAIRTTAQIKSTQMVKSYYQAGTSAVRGMVREEHQGAQDVESPASSVAGAVPVGDVTVASFQQLLQDLHEQQLKCRQLPEQVSLPWPCSRA